jgi:hypothetical protein
LKDLNNILSTLPGISLPEMDGVKLMDRIDTKFVMPASQLQLMLEKVQPFYKILVVEGRTFSEYKTLYFDTPDLAIYARHHNGSLNRYKIRYRNYVESQTGFLEIKFKSNKGRTLKDRIKQKNAPLVWDTLSSDFIRAKTPYDPDHLRPVLWVKYSRITLVNNSFSERVTIDLKLEFSYNTIAKSMENMAIIEVKRGSRSESPIIKSLKELKVKPISVSKYCLGIATIYPSVKKNNFKRKLTVLNKITHDNSFKLASVG